MFKSIISFALFVLQTADARACNEAEFDQVDVFSTKYSDVLESDLVCETKSLVSSKLFRFFPR